MDDKAYIDFLQASEKGLNKLAKRKIDSFVGSFEGMGEKERWVWENIEGLCGSEEHCKIRDELYSQVIFPVLLKGYQQSDPKCLYWLARTEQNHITVEPLRKQIGDKTAHELVRQAALIDPGDVVIAEYLLYWEAEFVQFSGHEWPAGLLCIGGQSEEQLLDWIDDVQQRDRLGRYHALFEEYRQMVEIYYAKGRDRQ